MRKPLKEENISNKLISVIIPTYNSEKTIKNSLESVFKQNIKNNIEIIIVDDKSTDKTIDVIKSYKKTDNISIKLIINKKNMGSGYSRNVGINNSKGYLIAFLDSDDIWLENKLEIQINFLKKNLDIEFVYSDYLKEFIKKDKLYYFHMQMPNYVSAKKNRYINHIPNSSVLIKSKTAKQFPYPSIRLRNDYLYWNTILLRNKSIQAYNASFGVPLFIYSHYVGISNRNFLLLKKQWLLYRKYFNYSFLESIFGMTSNILNYLIKKIKIKIYLITKCK